MPTMPNFQAITRDRHAHQRWQRISSYAFAANDTVPPLTAAELPKAIISLPVGFIEQADVFIPVAVLGVQPGTNLFVAPDGRWIGPYIPAAFRAYPFRLAATSEGEQVLCIDEDSGLITDGPEGESFFTEDGQPNQAVLDILNFLTQIEQNRVVTAAACAVLQKHELIRPWPITLKGDDGEQQIAGLFQIDEAALNQLSGEALLEILKAGGLPLAYCQLLSMQHLPMLGELTGVHAKVAAQAVAAKHIAASGELDLEFLNKGGMISFGNLN